MDRAKRTRTRAKNPSKAKSHQNENICLKSVGRRLPSAEKTGNSYYYYYNNNNNNY